MNDAEAARHHERGQAIGELIELARRRRYNPSRSWMRSVRSVVTLPESPRESAR